MGVRNKKAAVEVFFNNKCAVIPPSLYSKDGDTKEFYRYKGESLLTVPLDMIPTLMPKHIDELEQVVERYTTDNFNKRKEYADNIKPSRWGTIGAIAAKNLRENKTIEEAVGEMVKEDEKLFPGNSFFTKGERGFQCPNRS